MYCSMSCLLTIQTSRQRHVGNDRKTKPRNNQQRIHHHSDSDVTVEIFVLVPAGEGFVSSALKSTSPDVTLYAAVAIY